MTLLEFLLGSVVLLVVAAVPGAALLAALRIGERLPGVLVLPASAVLTVAVSVPASALQLHAGAPIRVFAGWLVLVTLGSSIAVVVRVGWRDGALLLLGRRGRPEGPRVAAGAGGLAPRGPATRWMLAAFAAITGLALLIGAGIKNDTIYHAAQVLKLERLASPTLDNTLQFPDGAAHPGYLVPVWHDLLGVASWTSGLHPVQLYWLSPAVLVSLYLLSWASLGAVAFGARRGAPIGAAAWVATDLLGTAPRMIPYEMSGQPRTWSLDIGVPVAITCMLLALWSSDRGRRRAAGVVMALAIVDIAFAHVSYLAFLGIGVAGYLLVASIASAASGRVGRGVLARHLLVGLVCLVTAGGAVATMVPRLEQLGTFASNGEAGRAESRIDAPANARVGVLFRGTHDAYRLRADRMLPQGGIALAVLLLGAVAVAAMGRHPLAWWAAGAGTIAIAVSYSSLLFPLLTDAISPAQSQRLAFALPLPIIGMVLLEQLARLVDAARRAGPDRRRRTGTIALGSITMAALLVGAASLAWRQLSAPKESVPPRLALAAEAVFVLAALVAMVRALRSREAGAMSHDPRAGIASTQDVPAATAGGGAHEAATLEPARGWQLARVGVVVGAVVLAALPLSMRLVEGVREELEDARPSGVRIERTANFPPEVVEGLERLPAGSTVLADPQNSYWLMAVAPVYVVSSMPGHTANVPANRIDERYALILDFFLHADDAERDQLLRSEGVDAILLARGAGRPEFQRWAETSPALGETLAENEDWELLEVR